MKEVFIENRKGLKMALRVTVNEKNDKLVFLLHGLGARKEYPHMLVLEEEFAKHGFNVVNIDATDSNNESEKSEEGITFTCHYYDLEDVISWARTQDFYVEPFSLAGQSMGAVACALYASKNTNKLNKLILANFSWIDGSAESENNRRKKIILEQGYYEQVSKSTGKSFLIKQNYLDDLKHYNLTKNIGNITAETHLIVGLKDSEYHIENNKKLYELLNCKKSLQLLPDVPHDLANTDANKKLFIEALENVFDKFEKKKDCF